MAQSVDEGMMQRQLMQHWVQSGDMEGDGRM